MNQTSWVVCHALLQECPPEKRSALLHRLTPKKQSELASLPIPRSNPLQPEPPLDTQLEKVHASWLDPFLRTLTENEVRLFLSSLKETQARELEQTLLFTNHLLPLKPLAKEFLQKTLWQQLDGEKQLPLSCLPESPLNILLDLNEKFLSQGIFLLGLHDLSQEMPHIIETTRLKKIYAALNSLEEFYLKSLLRKKEPVVFKKLSLSEWDGNVEDLRKMVQGRGLNRLAKSLYGENESLVWYVIHRLEMESAHQCLKLSVALQPAVAKSALMRQIEEMATFLKSRSQGRGP